MSVASDLLRPESEMDRYAALRSLDEPKPDIMAGWFLLIGFGQDFELSSDSLVTNLCCQTIIGFGSRSFLS